MCWTEMRYFVPLLALAACRTPTEVTLDITTDTCPNAYKGTSIAMGAPGDTLEISPPYTVTPDCNTNGSVGTFVVTPSDAKNARFEVRIVTGVDRPPEECTKNDMYKGCIVARRIMTFLPHTKLELPIEMLTDCKDQPCDALSTCVNASCVSAEITNPAACTDPTACELVDAAAVSLDGGSDAPTDAPDAQTDTPQESGGPVTVSEIASGGHFSCAVLQNALTTVQCWGANNRGELGNGDPMNLDQYTPVNVMALTQVTALSAGSEHACAVASGGVYCWGANDIGQLGANGAMDSNIPVNTIGSPNAVRVSAGDKHTCAIVGDAVMCWGDNTYGQLGNGVSAGGNSAMPVPVPSLSVGSQTTDISAGFRHTCAVVKGGVKCWGANESGQLGDGSGMTQPGPVQVAGLTTGFRKVIAGVNHSCALNNTEQVICWGTNRTGELGNGMQPGDSGVQPPAQIGFFNVLGAAQISGNDSQTNCALVLDGGSVACWGLDNAGQTGNPTFSTAPVQISGIPTSGVRFVSAGALHGCAALFGTGAMCWGDNDRGQLGNGKSLQSSVPPGYVSGY